MTIRASELLGRLVTDRQGERLGQVSDLLFEGPYPAGLSYALIALDHPPRRDRRTVAVPWSVLQLEGTEQPLVLDVSRETLHRLKNLRGTPRPASPVRRNFR